MIRKIWKKYRIGVVVTAVFAVFITFVAPNNLIDSARISRSIGRMERERKYFHDKAKEDSTFLENLKDDRFLEKYAREKFYMKRKGEEIYLIEE